MPARGESHKQRILDYIAARRRTSPITASEVAKALGIPVPSTRRTLSKLAQNGELSRTRKPGEYQKLSASRKTRRFAFVQSEVFDKLIRTLRRGGFDTDIVNSHFSRHAQKSRRHEDGTVGDGGVYDRFAFIFEDNYEFLVMVPIFEICRKILSPLYAKSCKTVRAPFFKSAPYRMSTAPRCGRETTLIVTIGRIIDDEYVRLGAIRRVAHTDNFNYSFMQVPGTAERFSEGGREVDYLFFYGVDIRMRVPAAIERDYYKREVSR